MALNDLLARLPDEDSVERHFCPTTTSITGKTPPFVITGDVSPTVFDALLELLESRPDPPSYLRHLELGEDGTLMIVEMASMWHDGVCGAITTALPRALRKAGYPEEAIQSYQAGQVSSEHLRPDGIWRPSWTMDEQKKILMNWPRHLKPDLKSGTLFLEVAFTETSEHVREKIENRWMSEKNFFPLLVLLIDFTQVASEPAILRGPPIELEVRLYRRKILDSEDSGFEISEIVHVKEAECIGPGLPQFMINIPVRELLYGTGICASLTDKSFIQLDMFYVVRQLTSLREGTLMTPV